MVSEVSISGVQASAPDSENRPYAPGRVAAADHGDAKMCPGDAGGDREVSGEAAPHQTGAGLGQLVSQDVPT